MRLELCCSSGADGVKDTCRCGRLVFGTTLFVVTSGTDRMTQGPGCSRVECVCTAGVLD
jgi:hypothetical protein